ncbi:glycosyltransferase family 4 protein [Calidifontimicrobium sp. SYSU G02091]|uniref:glycosyltransferase family 4 protein n=1 Tax=Calidifontimicrobium sp. SYSU G02091 TaxID=2926421 RepID=UPI001F53D73C|nr:glycosyltransferase family 4 protein [Calidifontimicrobium sp. SYSU G02091]MCI1193786.1 glycosyltransferase family 4 protein [Calidifontimicrobium sp. SYSU G02091]
MHILFLTDNFPPEVNAPASRTHEHAREWVKAGHRVTVITCAPNFPKGQVFAGYRNRLWQRENVDGIEVIRVWTYITANEGFLRRTLDYMSFMIAAVLAAPFVRDVDVIVGTSPQFFTACAAYAVSRYKRVPFVFELRDLWPESIRAVGAMQSPMLLRWLESLELFLYRRAALIVSVTHSFKRDLERRGISGDKIVVITNGVDLSHFAPRTKDDALARDLGLNGKFVAGYLGTHGLAHGLRTILEAARQLKAQPEGADVVFVLLGDGAEKKALKAEAERLGLDNVLFLDTVPKHQIPRYWSLLNVSIVHLRRAELFTSVIPSKLFECMSMGVPVLHGVTGESAEIVEREGVGRIFEPENAEQLAKTLLAMKGNRDLLESYRVRCLKAAPRYDRAVLAMRMLAHIQQAVGGAVRSKT